MASIRTQDDDYESPVSGGTAQGPDTSSVQAPPLFTGAYSPASGNTGISGYGLPGGVAMPPVDAPPKPYAFNQNAFNTAFNTATTGRSGTLQEWQNSIFPSLQSQFPDIQSFGSKGDKIRLPNGQVIDAVISAGAGGRGYALQYDNPTAGYFDDPLLQGYLNFGQGAIDSLMQPQGIHPVLQQAIDALTRMTSQGAPHMDMSALGPLQDAVTKRLGQIDQPGWSPAQQDLLRTNVSDPIEAQRTAAQQQVIQRFAAQGLSPSSGIVQQALLDVDRNFSQLRTTGERDLATKEMAQDEARKQEAVQISQMLAQLGLTGAQANLSADVSGRGQNLSAAGQLAGVGSQLQDAPMQHLMQAMGIYGNMAQLPFQANANAIASMNAVNGQPVPQADNSASLIQLLLSLAGGGENAANNAAGNQDAFWSALGTSLPDLLSSFADLFGQKPKPHTGTPDVPAYPSN
jgi:hypothetical protein